MKTYIVKGSGITGFGGDEKSAWWLMKEIIDRGDVPTCQEVV